MTTILIPKFVGFPKIARLNRTVIVTEKIDGTNAQVYITESGDIFAGSRNRWITPQADNAGFARWVEEHKAELLQLGPGQHFGEWWGQGIQRNYGLKEKRFSLFNTSRWGDPTVRPPCCGCVPVISAGPLQESVESAMAWLRDMGSVAAPGFMRPEGIIIFHTANSSLFKVTLEDDKIPKGMVGKS